MSAVMKRFFLFLLFFFCALSVEAAQLKQVRLALNRADGIYAKGDKVVVTACADEGFKAPLEMYVLLNGRNVLTKELTLGAEPVVVYEGSFDRSLCGMVYIQRRDKKGVDTGVGFAVATEGLHPGFTEPKDYRKFWKKELKAMRAVKPEVKLVEVALPDGDAAEYICYDLEISMHEGWPVRGYLVMPRGAAQRSLPIVMYFHGAGVVKPSCRSTVETALNYAKMGGGCIAVDINAHGMLNAQPQSYYDGLENGYLKDYRCRPFTTKEELYYKDMMLRDVRALDYLCTLKEWDGKRVLVTGTSQGGNQSCAVAGLDRRVTQIVAIVPGYCDMGAILDPERQSGWTRLYRDVNKYPGAKEILPYYESAFALRHTRAGLWMEVGFMDQTCPVEGMYAAFNGAVSKHKSIHPYPYRRHSMSSSDQYYKQWKKDIEASRLEFLNEYLK